MSDLTLTIQPLCNPGKAILNLSSPDLYDEQLGRVSERMLREHELRISRSYDAQSFRALTIQVAGTPSFRHGEIIARALGEELSANVRVTLAGH